MTATTAPSSAERTGAASRPAREPSADRMPSTALGGRPAVAAACPHRVTGGDSRPLRQPVRRHTVGDEQRGRRQQHDEHEEPEPEDRPVEGHADVGIDGPDRADRSQRGQGHGDRHREERPEHDGAHDADEPVGHGHRRPGPQGAHDGALLRVPPDQTADHLAVDHERSEGRDEPENPEGDCFGSDGTLGLGDVRRPGGGSPGGTEVGDDLVDGGDDGRLVRRPAVEVERDIGVVGAARLEPPGRPRG